MGTSIIRAVPSAPNRPASSEAPPAERLRGFIAKFTPAHQRLIRALRAALRARWPGAHELVYDNYNFFVIGYSPTVRPSDAIVSIVAGPDRVSLCFIYGVGLPDPQRLLIGTGNQTRVLRLSSATVLKRPAVRALLSAAEADSDVPFARTGRGSLVVRSVSLKQRPRRR